MYRSAWLVINAHETFSLVEEVLCHATDFLLKQWDSIVMDREFPATAQSHGQVDFHALLKCLKRWV